MAAAAPAFSAPFRPQKRLVVTAIPGAPGSDDDDNDSDGGRPAPAGPAAFSAFEHPALKRVLTRILRAQSLPALYMAQRAPPFPLRLSGAGGGAAPTAAAAAVNRAIAATAAPHPDHAAQERISFVSACWRTMSTSGFRLCQ